VELDVCLSCSANGIRLFRGEPLDHREVDVLFLARVCGHGARELLGGGARRVGVAPVEGLHERLHHEVECAVLLPPAKGCKGFRSVGHAHLLPAALDSTRGRGLLPRWTRPAARGDR
jgi:hypothetical protein